MDEDPESADRRDLDAAIEDSSRRPWHEGPDEDAPEESWLALDDDSLLHRIETLGAEEDQDDCLLEIVAGDRHFFIRQEAAKRVRDRRQLFAYEDDRHVGQILVRHLTRREDLTYLERLSMRSRHVEVRSAAQVQLARVWKKIEAPRPTMAPLEAVHDPGLTPVRGVAARPTLAAGTASPPAGQPLTSAVVERDGVDGSLLGWAVHFVVENAWGHLGTTATRELLRRTQREMQVGRASLVLFVITDDAHVTADLAPGARIPREAVQHVAEWMTSFRRAAREVAPDVLATSVRGCTSLMADALRDSGFYAACDAAEAAGKP